MIRAVRKRRIAVTKTYRQLGMFAIKHIMPLCHNAIMVEAHAAQTNPIPYGEAMGVHSAAAR